jgi:hypothetical protein
LAQVLSGYPSARRRTILTIEVVLLGMLDMLLTPVLTSFLQVADRLRAGEVDGVPRLSFTNAAFYKRLKTLPHTLFLDLFRQVTKALASRRKHRRDAVAALAPFATGIYAVDDTTLDAMMRKTPALQAHAKGDPATLAGRLGCVVDLVTGAFADVLYDDDAAANEKTHLLPLIQRLPTGALFVMDLGYFSFPLFDAISQAHSFFLTRLREKTSMVDLQVLANRPYYRDRIVHLGKWSSNQAAYPVRVVELLIAGTWFRYLTNVLSPHLFPASHVWAMYAQRWTIEKSFAVVKRALGMAFLHTCHQNGVLIQIWCTLSVYQVLQDLRLEIAARHGWAEDEVSWFNLMQRISWFAAHPAHKGPSLRRWLVREAPTIALQKRGVRVRCPEGLPWEVVRDCQLPVSPVNPEYLPVRKPRQRKAEPRTKVSTIVQANLPQHSS